MNKVEITTEYIELQQLLKFSGMCLSGGEAKQAIVNELVEVDGELETRKKCKIRPGQRVLYAGEELEVTLKAD